MSVAAGGQPDPLWFDSGDVSRCGHSIASAARVKESLTVVDELHDRGIGHDLLQRPRPHHVSVSDDTPIAHERGEHAIPAAH